MSYNKEWRRIFIEKQTELFAQMLCLNIKYNKNISIDILLNDSLDNGWHLSYDERKKITKKAIKIAVKQYGLNESQLHKTH